MKPIDYERSKGSFTIKYLEDGETYSGTINIDDKSLETKKLIKCIIDNEEGSTFTFKANNESQSVDILLVKKNIDVVFEEINEVRFKSIKCENQLNSDNIYFKFCYKPDEHNKPGTPSYEIIMGLKRFSQVEYKKLKNIFIFNFLKKFDNDLLDYDIIVCVPSHCMGNYNDNPLARMIEEISKIYIYVNGKKKIYTDGSQYLLRYKTVQEQKTQKKRCEGTHLDSVKLKENINVNGKNIILIDDIATSGSSLRACKKILKDAGANEVICFAFGKTVKQKWLGENKNV